MKSPFKQPVASLPIAMSLAALTLLLGHLALFGIVRETDEGTAAHLFQILMATQVPIIIFFAVKWLPQNPKQTLTILTLQFLAAIAAFAPVYFFRL